MLTDELTDERLEDLARLLARLPKVTIAWTQVCPSIYRIGMRIDDASSLGLIVHLNRHWNVSLSVETDWECTAAHDAPECVRYDLRIPRRAGALHSDMSRVAEILITAMKARGLLTTREAGDLRRMWPEAGQAPEAG
jgi:hypothetical protein